jgi:anti-anti-sigma factor
MNVTVTQEDGYLLAKATGPIDESALESFRDRLHPLVARHGAQLIVDLSGSPRITSTGIARLVILVTDANTHGSRVIFAAPTSFVDGVFRVSRLDRFFEIAGTVVEAIDMLGVSASAVPARGG